MPETTDQQTQTPEPTTAGGGTPTTFAEFLAQQPEEIKALYEAEIKGLKAALDAERAEKREVAKQLRDAAAQAEAGSAAQQQLTAAAERAERAEAKADFLADAHGAGVSDLELAWLVVSANPALSNSRGAVDFAALREKHPALFAPAGGGKPAPVDNGAGTGGGGAPGGAAGMNKWILQQAGRT